MLLEFLRNRRLDGLPPRMVVGQSAPKQAKMDEIHYVELDSEEVMMAVAETEEKKNFVEAKRISLVRWCDNDAWRPVKRTEAPNGTIVPMRFLLRYKEDKPNARVIPQGFKHRDVVQGKLDTESPTLSRFGKYLIVLLGCIERWKFGTIDVKSAFLQSDYIHHKVQLYGEPSADMRRLRSEIIGLKEHEVMMMTKPAFGDVRAPRQWNETADNALTKEVGLWKHRLDGCIYLSTRVATKQRRMPSSRFSSATVRCWWSTVCLDFTSMTYWQLEKEAPRLRMLMNHKENRSATQRDSTCCYHGPKPSSRSVAPFYLEPLSECISHVR